MISRIASVPFFVLLMGIGSLAMLVPAVYGAAIDDLATARAFLYAAILFFMLTLLIGVAMGGYHPGSPARSHLTTLLAAFTVLPLMLAIPFHEAVGHSTLLDAWFEMVSSLTTTGATIYDNPMRLSPALHLWRSVVGWLGGLFAWVTAVAILAPMNLGGFEVQSTGTMGDGGRTFSQIARIADPAERLVRFTLRLGPIYVGLTFVLWLCLLLAGEVGFIALCHAMAVMSTSGISPVGGTFAASSGFAGEAFMVLFWAFALSRLTFSRGILGEAKVWIGRDPEVRLAVALIGSVTTLLFLRHFFGAVTENTPRGILPAAQALWGGFFTVVSFVTTTGFESRYWLGSTDWSGLSQPGLLLVGLSLVGGGIATTAGGVKLLRVYALLRHGERELERLVHPHSVGGSGREARQIRRKGAYVAWIFFMLFALSIAAVLVALSLTGVQFENALVLAVASLSTTGPLAVVAAEAPISIAGIPDGAKMILAAAMVLGRLEALAIIALLNPDFWRN